MVNNRSYVSKQSLGMLIENKWDTNILLNAKRVAMDTKYIL